MKENSEKTQNEHVKQQHHKQKYLEIIHLCQQ